jgi:uncharacterized membrane protein YdcZ (DUF606 family)
MGRLMNALLMGICGGASVFPAIHLYRNHGYDLFISAAVISMILMAMTIPLRYRISRHFRDADGIKHDERPH